MVFLLVCGFFFACTPDQEAGPSTVYTVRGRFVGLRFEGAAMRVQHEAIPGYMESMTMDFKLKNPREAASLTDGDKIEFRYVVSDDDAYAEGIRLLLPDVELQLGDDSAREEASEP